jgi:hypothetical protein
MRPAAFSATEAPSLPRALLRFPELPHTQLVLALLLGTVCLALHLERSGGAQGQADLPHRALLSLPEFLLVLLVHQREDSSGRQLVPKVAQIVQRVASRPKRFFVLLVGLGSKAVLDRIDVQHCARDRLFVAGVLGLLAQMATNV